MLLTYTIYYNIDGMECRHSFDAASQEEAIRYARAHLRKHGAKIGATLYDPGRGLIQGLFDGTMGECLYPWLDPHFHPSDGSLA